MRVGSVILRESGLNLSLTFSLLRNVIYKDDMMVLKPTWNTTATATTKVCGYI